MLFYYTMDDAFCNRRDPENPANSSADLTRGRPLLLAVLIPHPNAAAVLWRYKRALFRSGAEGAYAFPPAIPLSILPSPLNRESLRALAQAIREGSLEGGRNGRITAPHLGESARWKTCPIPGLPLYGPELDLPLNWQGPEGATPLKPLILPLTIREEPLLPASAESAPYAERSDNRIVPDPRALNNFFFTAAYVAVMKLRPLGRGFPGLSYAWRFGEVRWLGGLKRKDAPRRR